MIMTVHWLSAVFLRLAANLRLVIGALIIVWTLSAVTDLGWINKITMAAGLF